MHSAKDRTSIAEDCEMPDFELLDDNSVWSRISLELGVNRERIKQVERNAIRKANAALTLLERKVLRAHYGIQLDTKA